MSQRIKEFDQNIINALKDLPVPLKTFDNHLVLFDVGKRNETIYEHIADKKHYLHVIDIKRIPFILSDKTCLKTDKHGKRYRSYIGRRGKKKERLKYLKIITEVKKNNKESIITIYPVKNND